MDCPIARLDNSGLGQSTRIPTANWRQTHGKLTTDPCNRQQTHGKLPKSNNSHRPTLTAKPANDRPARPPFLHATPGATPRAETHLKTHTVLEAPASI
eukprot:11163077-Lingulodinium_polyedra.AAC.1